MDVKSPMAIKSLRQLAEAEKNCTRCALYRDATQAVGGEGPERAALMLVGEQPGDKEDLAGKPFVGPAGRILDRALQDAGIARDETFLTNAVKHFKHEIRGKRRLHKRPNTSEIERCKRVGSDRGAILGRSGLEPAAVDATGEIFGEVPYIAARAQALAEAVTIPGTGSDLMATRGPRG